MMVEETETPIIIKKKGRPSGASNNTNYHWHVTDNETGKKTSYKTLAQVKDVYGIHRGTAYLIVKNPNIVPRKYSHIKLEKKSIHQHLIPTEQKYNP